MNNKVIMFFFGLSLLFSSCASKTYTKQDTALIVFKTATFKYADMGFVYENEEEVKVEIYASGQALMSLRILEDSVCMSVFECMTKESFNQSVLSHTYPKETLETIFRGEKIFSSKGVLKSSNGFTQHIVKQGKYNIYYSVFNKDIIFRDTINAILIKIKKP